MALEAKAFAQFDKLAQQGEILWQDAAPRYVASHPFDFQFRVGDSLAKKPRTAGTKKRTPAFTGDSEDFTIGTFGPRHKLILNKYCVVRPQLVLHTIEFENQDELLNDQDFEAAWLALTSLGDKYMVIYNGGKDAGASLNHKHLQVVPRPERAGLETLLKGSGSEAEIRSRLSDVPFQLYVRSLSERPDGTSLQELFLALRKEAGLKPTDAYNMILYHQHMIVVPRRTANIDGVDANAAGMTGVVWCSSEEQYQEWVRRGPMKWLLDFGVPKGN